MKTLILISLLLISTNLFSQDKAVIKTELVTDRANDWMTNIATNPHMRSEMMRMIIKNTMDKPYEMRLLINQILSNSEMKDMIRKTSFQNSNSADNSMNLTAKMNKYNNVMKKTAPQKKPKIKN